MKNKIQFKTFKIPKLLHDKVLSHCNEKGLVMYKWIEKILLKEIEKEKEDDNL